MSSERFSSALQKTRSGRAARIAARSGFFVPPIARDAPQSLLRVDAVARDPDEIARRPERHEALRDRRTEGNEAHGPDSSTTGPARVTSVGRGESRGRSLRSCPAY